ncbi:MAG: hypothetical protein JJE04_10715 [Acidobacteriia bacterium]|nr:hypothetical protein [Terriglobia bacterium]
MKRLGIWIAVIFGVAFLAIMFTSTRGLSAHRVEVCVEYEGRSDCRTASGATKETALNTARVNACAHLSSGMTDSIACQNTPPTKVNWLSGK